MKTMKRFDLPSSSDLPRNWLKAEEYLALAVSNRRLARCDEPENGIRGLVDLVTGERFFIREEQALLSDLGFRRPRGAVLAQQHLDS
jgi:hypothetical protein